MPLVIALINQKAQNFEAQPLASVLFGRPDCLTGTKCTMDTKQVKMGTQFFTTRRVTSTALGVSDEYSVIGSYAGAVDVSGNKAGYGVRIYSDGSRYVGNWVDGRWDGEGEYFRAMKSSAGPTLDRREGATGTNAKSSNKQAGWGALTADNKTAGKSQPARLEYRGSHVRGSRTGRGTLYFYSDLTVNTNAGQLPISVYSGDVVEGVPNGSGTERLKDGTLYRGGFEGALRSGEGQLVTHTGDVFAGAWSHGEKSGDGVFVSVSKARLGSVCPPVLDRSVGTIPPTTMSVSVASFDGCGAANDGSASIQTFVLVPVHRGWYESGVAVRGTTELLNLDDAAAALADFGAHLDREAIVRAAQQWAANEDKEANCSAVAQLPASTASSSDHLSSSTRPRLLAELPPLFLKAPGNVLTNSDAEGGTS